MHDLQSCVTGRSLGFFDEVPVYGPSLVVKVLATKQMQVIAEGRRTKVGPEPSTDGKLLIDQIPEQK